MTPVIVALYDDYGIADHMRVQPVADGFATDRVEVASRLEADRRTRSLVTASRIGSRTSEGGRGVELS
jgi:hypothetical protein